MICRSYVYCNTIKVNRPTNNPLNRRESSRILTILSLFCLIPSDYRDITIICL